MNDDHLLYGMTAHRTGRRSNESIELQPLHVGAVKGVLRRMPRVRSDENSAENDYAFESAKEKTPSPIGAGLPLLQRLLLLKEKQVGICLVSIGIYTIIPSYRRMVAVLFVFCIFLIIIYVLPFAVRSGCADYLQMRYWFSVTHCAF